MVRENNRKLRGSVPSDRACTRSTTRRSRAPTGRSRWHATQVTHGVIVRWLTRGSQMKCYPSNRGYRYQRYESSVETIFSAIAMQTNDRNIVRTTDHTYQNISRHVVERPSSGLLRGLIQPISHTRTHYYADRNIPSSSTAMGETLEPDCSGTVLLQRNSLRYGPEQFHQRRDKLPILLRKPRMAGRQAPRCVSAITVSCAQQASTGGSQEHTNRSVDAGLTCNAGANRVTSFMRLRLA